MQNDILINGFEADLQIIELADLSHREIRKPSLRMRAGALTAFLIGAASSNVYFNPAQDATNGDSNGYKDIATLGTILTNAILNVYFNLLAIEEVRRFKDPVTHQLALSKTSMLINGAVSFMSALCIAFINLDDDSNPVLSSLNLLFLIFSYTAQHYVGVVDFSEFLVGLYNKVERKIHSLMDESDDEEGIKAAMLKSQIIEKLEFGYITLGKRFSESVFSVDEFYTGNFDTLETDRLIKQVFELQLPPPTPPRNFLVKIMYTILQVTGVSSQLIANIGYYNSTINGFLKFVNLSIAWSLATGSVAPFYCLSFVVSCQSIDRIVSFFEKVLPALMRRQWDCILDEIPYAIRKTPKFSLLTGSLLTILASMSPFAALVLTEEAIYGTNSRINPYFEWMDPEQNFPRLYLMTTLAAAVFFNIFPVPDVQNYISSLYCRMRGTVQEKHAIETLKVLKATKQRVERIPEKAFGAGIPLQGWEKARLYPINPVGRDENCCTKLTKWFCGLWSSRKNEYNIQGSRQSYHRIPEDKYEIHGLP